MALIILLRSFFVSSGIIAVVKIVTALAVSAPFCHFISFWIAFITAPSLIGSTERSRPTMALVSASAELCRLLFQAQSS